MSEITRQSTLLEVASRQKIEWDVLAAWFIKEGAGEEEYERFRHATDG